MKKKLNLILSFPLVFLLTLLVFNLSAFAGDEVRFIGFDKLKPLFLEKKLITEDQGQQEPEIVAPAEPVITGVKNGQIYGEKVAACWEEVAGVCTTATLNGYPYLKNKTITQEGKYVLIVTAEKQRLKSEKVIRFSIDKQLPQSIKVRGIEDGFTYRSAIATWGSIKGTIITASVSKGDKKELPYIAGERITENGEYLLKITTTRITNGLETVTKIPFTINNEAPLVPDIIGVADGGVYTRVITPTWNVPEGTTVNATLNEKEYKRGTPIIADGVYQITVTASENNKNIVSSKTVNFVIDTTAPQVIAPAQAATTDQQIYVASSEDSGFVYIIQEHVSAKNLKDLEAAVKKKKGAKAPVSREKEYCGISTCKLLPGTYYAYAIDGTCHLSEKGSNEIKILAKRKSLPNRYASSVELNKTKAVANGKDGGVFTVYLYNKHGQPYLQSAWVYAASDRYKSDVIEAVDEETVCVHEKGVTALLSNKGVVRFSVKSHKSGEAKIAAGFNDKVYDFITNDPEVDEKVADIIDGTYGRKKIKFLAEKD